MRILLHLEISSDNSVMRLRDDDMLAGEDVPTLKLGLGMISRCNLILDPRLLGRGSYYLSLCTFHEHGLPSGSSNSAGHRRLGSSWGCLPAGLTVGASRARFHLRRIADA